MARKNKKEKRALEGVRVLDFGRVVAGPHCAQMMCAMGADVIKIERPVHGDDIRFDPYIYEPGLSAAYMQQNWGKRSLSIDLRHEKAKRIIIELVRKSDVVIENFRPGVMDRLGFSYKTLSEVNPSIIMCSISAFGQTGPYSERLGMGPIAEAVAGIPEVTGDPDGPPMPTLYPIADNLAAALACSAVCASLYWRDRSGVGQYIDMSLLDAAFQGQDLAFEQYLASEGRVQMTRKGLRDVTFVPWGFFKGNDGWIVIMCANESMWEPLTQALDREDMAKDPRYDSFDHRYENRDDVYRAIEEWVSGFASVQEAVDILVERGVPCEKVHTIADAVNNPQVIARNLIVEREHPTLGKMKVVNSGLNLSHTPADIYGYPPFLGEHNNAVLQDLLGFDEETVKNLSDEGVIYQDPRSTNIKPQ